MGLPYIILTLATGNVLSELNPFFRSQDLNCTAHSGVVDGELGPG